MPRQDLDDPMLTPSQAEILGFVIEGLSNKEIAFRRGTSEQAVKRHVSALFRRFEVDSRARLIARALSDRSARTV